MQSNGPTILIVEEIQATRLAASRAASEAGFKTLEASTADDGLKILNTRNDISLVCTAVNTTGKIDGLQLAVQVHKDWPDVAIVLTSAVANLRQSSLPNRCRFLRKPYRTEALIGCFQLLTENWATEPAAQD